MTLAMDDKEYEQDTLFDEEEDSEDDDDDDDDDDNDDGVDKEDEEEGDEPLAATDEEWETDERSCHSDRSASFGHYDVVVVVVEEENKEEGPMTKKRCNDQFRLATRA